MILKPNRFRIQRALRFLQDKKSTDEFKSLKKSRPKDCAKIQQKIMVYFRNRRALALDKRLKKKCTPNGLAKETKRHCLKDF